MKLTTLLLLALTTSACLGQTAVTAASPTQPKAHQVKNHGWPDVIKVTPEQGKKMDILRKKFSEDVKAIKPEDERVRMAELSKKLRKDLFNILTAEQQKTYNKWLEKRQGKG